MKIRSSLLAFLGCFLLIATVACKSNQGTNTSTSSAIKTGDVVAAAFGPSWYLATITSSNGDKYDVTYADNTTGTLSISEIKPIVLDMVFKVGDNVMAVWNSGKFYDGEVVEITPNGYIIKWTDGSAPSEVKKGHVMKK